MSRNRLLLLTPGACLAVELSRHTWNVEILLLQLIMDGLGVGVDKLQVLVPHDLVDVLTSYHPRKSVDVLAVVNCLLVCRPTNQEGMAVGSMEQLPCVVPIQSA